MFGFLKKKKSMENHLEKLAEVADILSGNNAEVHTAITCCIHDPAAYGKQHAARFLERSMDVEHCDAATLCWVALVDELEASGDLAEVDTSCEPEDLQWALEQLNPVQSAETTVPEPETESFFDWLCEYRDFFRQQNMVLCTLEMDSDDVFLALVQKEQFDAVVLLAKQAKCVIAEADIQ